MDKEVLKKTSLRVLISLIPLCIAGIYNFSSSEDLGLSNYLLSGIVGFGPVILYSLVRLQDTTDSVEDNSTKIKNRVGRLRTSVPEVYETREGRRSVVERMYESNGNYILATDFYEGQDKSHRYNGSDLGEKLYKGSNKSYDRFVSVSCMRDKEWVCSQLDNSDNDNFSLFVIEGVPEEFLTPNYVIVRTDGIFRAFVSYPSHMSEGGFGHLINSPEVSNAINNYFVKLRGRAEHASTCRKRWNSVG